MDFYSVKNYNLFTFKCNLQKFMLIYFEMFIHHRYMHEALNFLSLSVSKSISLVHILNAFLFVVPFLPSSLQPEHSSCSSCDY